MKKKKTSCGHPLHGKHECCAFGHGGLVERTREVECQKLMGQYYALLECSNHLQMDWTDDGVERREGIRVAKQLRSMALRRLVRARQLKKQPRCFK